MEGPLANPFQRKAWATLQGRILKEHTTYKDSQMNNIKYELKIARRITEPSKQQYLGGYNIM